MEFVNLDDFEKHAKTILPKQAYDYYSSGANAQQTLRDNVEAFQRIRLLPRILRGVTRVDTETCLLGSKVASPILVAPTAMQMMAHFEGEKATARACQKANTIMCVSSWATTSLEDVAASAPEGLRWFQLYVYNDRKASEAIVRRAERAGYKALVLTVDTPVLGRREADVRNGFSLPAHLSLANFSRPEKAELDPTEAVPEMKEVLDNERKGRESALAAYVAAQIDRSLSWKDIAWLKSITALPIVLKGVHTKEDAKLAVEHGVEGIWVSNHGARQLDGVPAAIDMLPEIVEAVQGRAEVYVDGGIRNGTSVFKALALGAKAVFLGRPVLWSLACKGEEGVAKMLELINNEFTLAMTLIGCKSLAEISPEYVIRPGHSRL